MAFFKCKPESGKYMKTSRGDHILDDVARETIQVHYNSNTQIHANMRMLRKYLDKGKVDRDCIARAYMTLKHLEYLIK